MLLLPKIRVCMDLPLRRQDLASYRIVRLSIPRRIPRRTISEGAMDAPSAGAVKCPPKKEEIRLREAALEAQHECELFVRQPRQSYPVWFTVSTIEPGPKHVSP